MDRTDSSPPTAAAPGGADPRWRPDTGRWRRAFTAYARWLDSISWLRFTVLSVLVLILSGVLQDIPPFNIPWGRDRTEYREAVGNAKEFPKAPIQIEGVKGSDGRRYEIRIDGGGIQVRPVPPAPPPRPPAPPVTPPAGVIGEAAREAPAMVREAAQEAAAEAARAASEAAASGDPTAREIAEALSEAREALADAGLLDNGSKPEEVHIRAYRLGDGLPQLAFLLIVLSLVTKVMAAGRFRAEAQAEEATEKAESESLRRQVVEARMAAMQAQVEPHFLFNTLASIDHLIETDPPRASQMQRNLIALLRASMPSLRETGAAAGPRELRRELEMVRPYLEILKVRMDERLEARIDVPDGLLSAEFPPMMMQGLVENAIKHGLEPKAEGGRLEVTAVIEHGRLVVRVADTGLGFGEASTRGTGTGLANMRERLLLLYGDRATLTVAENPGGGTVATITLPYRSLHGTSAA
jgi:signal transduction histidine kinase